MSKPSRVLAFALVALLSVTAAATRALAQPCIGVECTGITHGPWIPDEDDPTPESLRPLTSRSPGAEWLQATQKVRVTVQNMATAMAQEDPVAQAAAIEQVMDAIDAALETDPFRDLVRDLGTAAGADLADQIDPSGAGSLTVVDTGLPHQINADGSTDPGTTMDPVEPVRGELEIVEIDLELPSSGIPIRFARTYRSRIAYSGPLGPAWDHTYNQRLFNVEADGEATPLPALPASADLLTTRIPADLLASLRPDSLCGPLLAMSTGNGTTLTFREISRADGTARYASAASQLTLVGTEAHGTMTWTLATSRGDVRHFDRYGRLVRWVDPNGLGLTLSWAGADGGRLESIEDAEGRVVDLEYDALGRLTRIAEPDSELEATYTYGFHGGLEIATRADGRREQYVYDFDPLRDRGDWVAEGHVVAACEVACAPVNAPSCTGGGACEAPVAEATAACLASCEPCALDCRAECPDACADACRDQARADCEQECAKPETRAEMRNLCIAAYDAIEEKYPPPIPVPVPDEFCFGCVEACEFEYQPGYCSYNVSFEDHGFPVLPETEWGCTDRGRSCCISGEQCAEGSRTEGEKCYEVCKDAFFGFGGHVSNSLPPGATEEDCYTTVDPAYCSEPGICPDDAPTIEICPTTTAWANTNGCLPLAMEKCVPDCIRTSVYGSAEPPVPSCVEPCTAECGEACDAACRRDDCPAACAELDLAGQCESACTSACIDTAHAAGPTPGPEYGHDIDLNFNIIAVYDGAGRLYLANEYGTDLGSPDFVPRASCVIG